MHQEEDEILKEVARYAKLNIRKESLLKILLLWFKPSISKTTF
jgi:hypothetical protein